MAQQGGAFAALVEGLSLVPSSRVRGSQLPVTPAGEESGFDAPFSLVSPRHLQTH